MNYLINKMESPGLSKLRHIYAKRKARQAVKELSPELFRQLLKDDLLYGHFSVKVMRYNWWQRIIRKLRGLPINIERIDPVRDINNK